MGNNKGKLFLVLLIVVPVLWVLIWKSGKHSYQTLPVFGEVEMTGDTVPFEIPPFAFINQNGETVTEKNFEGKIYVANFFFATCPDICPAMNKNLALVYDKFKNNPNVMFISHTVHPEHDSVPVLAEYARNFEAKLPKWHFVTGDKIDIYTLAENDYRVTTTKGSGPEDFIHSEKLVLIDQNKHIRGYYESRDFQDVQKLMDGIKVLLADSRKKILNKQP